MFLIQWYWCMGSWCVEPKNREGLIFHPFRAHKIPSKGPLRWVQSKRAWMGCLAPADVDELAESLLHLVFDGFSFRMFIPQDTHRISSWLTSEVEDMR